MTTVTIYSASHVPVKEYKAIGSLDQIIEGARIQCGQLLETRGKRARADFTDENGDLITRHVFYEVGEFIRK